MGCVVVVMEGVSQVGSPASKYLPEAQLDSTISIREPTETAHHLPPFQVAFQVPTRTLARTLARITYVCRPAVRWGLDSLIRPQVRKARQGQVEEGSLSLHGRGLGGIRPFLGVCGCAGVRVCAGFVLEPICARGRGGEGRGVRWNGVLVRDRQRGGSWPRRRGGDPSNIHRESFDSAQGWVHGQGMQDAWACRRGGGGKTVWHLTLWDARPRRTWAFSGGYRAQSGVNEVLLLLLR